MQGSFVEGHLSLSAFLASALGFSSPCEQQGGTQRRTCYARIAQHTRNSPRSTPWIEELRVYPPIGIARVGNSQGAPTNTSSRQTCSEDPSRWQVGMVLPVAAPPADLP